MYPWQLIMFLLCLSYLSAVLRWTDGRLQQRIVQQFLRRPSFRAALVGGETVDVTHGARHQPRSVLYTTATWRCFGKSTQTYRKDPKHTEVWFQSSFASTQSVPSWYFSNSGSWLFTLTSNFMIDPVLQPPFSKSMNSWSARAGAGLWAVEWLNFI